MAPPRCRVRLISASKHVALGVKQEGIGDYVSVKACEPPTENYYPLTPLNVEPHTLQRHMSSIEEERVKDGCLEACP